MYGYTMHIPAPIDVYHATHQAVLDVVREEGGGDGLVLHLAYATAEGFDLTEVWASKEHFDAFNRDVFSKALARAGMSQAGPPSQPIEFIPAGVVTPGPFSSPEPA
jgi:hypothetical protein